MKTADRARGIDRRYDWLGLLGPVPSLDGPGESDLTNRSRRNECCSKMASNVTRHA